MPRTPASRNVRPATVTDAPSVAARCARARPMPPVPPTTSTLLPASAARCAASPSGAILRAALALPNIGLQGKWNACRVANKCEENTRAA